VMSCSNVAEKLPAAKEKDHDVGRKKVPIGSSSLIVDCSSPRHVGTLGRRHCVRFIIADGVKFSWVAGC